MALYEIFLIAFGLSMDCFAVSIAESVCCQFDWKKLLRMALFFGLFQGIMPLITWTIGINFAKQIDVIDHWLAFIILAFLGGKMIYESFQKKELQCVSSSYNSIKVLVQLSIATSIDALATGLIFVPLGTQVFGVVAIIFTVSFLMTLLGGTIGYWFGKKFKFNVELLGGIILIGIGVKMLLEHLLNH